MKVDLIADCARLAGPLEAVSVSQAQLDRVEAEGIEVVEPQDIRTFLGRKLAPEARAG